MAVVVQTDTDQVRRRWTIMAGTHDLPESTATPGTLATPGHLVTPDHPVLTAVYWLPSWNSPSATIHPCSFLPNDGMTMTAISPLLTRARQAVATAHPDQMTRTLHQFIAIPATTLVLAIQCHQVNYICGRTSSYVCASPNMPTSCPLRRLCDGLHQNCADSSADLTFLFRPSHMEPDGYLHRNAHAVCMPLLNPVTAFNQSVRCSQRTQISHHHLLMEVVMAPNTLTSLLHEDLTDTSPPGYANDHTHSTEPSFPSLTGSVGPASKLDMESNPPNLLLGASEVHSSHPDILNPTTPHLACPTDQRPLCCHAFPCSHQPPLLELVMLAHLHFAPLLVLALVFVMSLFVQVSANTVARLKEHMTEANAQIACRQALKRHVNLIGYTNAVQDANGSHVYRYRCPTAADAARLAALDSIVLPPALTTGLGPLALTAIQVEHVPAPTDGDGQHLAYLRNVPATRNTTTYIQAALVTATADAQDEEHMFDAPVVRQKGVDPSAVGASGFVVIKTRNDSTMLQDHVDVLLAFGNKLVRDRLVDAGSFPGLDNTILRITAVEGDPNHPRGRFIKSLYDLPLGKSSVDVFESIVMPARPFVDGVTMAEVTTATGDIRQVARVYMSVEADWQHLLADDAALSLQRYSFDPPQTAATVKSITAIDLLRKKQTLPKGKSMAGSNKDGKDKDAHKRPRYKSPDPQEYGRRGRDDSTRGRVRSHYREEDRMEEEYGDYNASGNGGGPASVGAGAE